MPFLEGFYETIKLYKGSVFILPNTTQADILKIIYFYIKIFTLVMPVMLNKKYFGLF